MDHRTSRKLWLVAVKATFDIGENGSLSLAAEQEEVLQDPVYRGEEGKSSLLYDSDLMGLKQKVDVIVNGTAYQPGGEEGKELMVGIGIDGWGKLLKIVGHRVWDRFLGTSLKTMTQPFASMPLCYENAYGGVDEKAKPELQTDYRNPVGKGYAAAQSHLSGKRMPTIEYPDFPTKANHKKNRVAGLGAIANYWQPRIRHAGTYDEEWQTSQAPFLPSDFSPLYYQSAPQDQQLDQLSGGERVTMIHLLPNRSRCSFTLPLLRFELSTRINTEVTYHSPLLRTVVIESDTPRLIMTWQSAINCHDEGHLIDVTTVNIAATNGNMPRSDKSLLMVNNP